MALVPGKNPTALIAYYLGIFALIPCVGCALGPAAIVCGIIGLVQASKNPVIAGKGHAVAGIVLGVIAPLVWGVVLYFLFRS